MEKETEGRSQNKNMIQDARYRIKKSQILSTKSQINPKIKYSNKQISCIFSCFLCALCDLCGELSEIRNVDVRFYVFSSSSRASTRWTALVFSPL